MAADLADAHKTSEKRMSQHNFALSLHNLFSSFSCSIIIHCFYILAKDTVGCCSSPFYWCGAFIMSKWWRSWPSQTVRPWSRSCSPQTKAQTHEIEAETKLHWDGDQTTQDQDSGRDQTTLRLRPNYSKLRLRLRSNYSRPILRRRPNYSTSRLRPRPNYIEVETKLLNTKIETKLHWGGDQTTQN